MFRRLWRAIIDYDDGMLGPGGWSAALAVTYLTILGALIYGLGIMILRR
jgi:hypothetical protein